MTITRTLTALALGILVAGAASAQQHPHAGMTMTDHGMNMPPVKDYDDPGGGGGSGGDPNPAAGCVGAQNVVRINGFSFSPSTITITAGQAVCWTWDGSTPHTVTADNSSFNSGSPASSGNFQVTFPTAGTFGYFCQVHGSTTGGMRGTITVTGTTGGGGDGGGGGTDDGPGKIQLSASGYTIVEGATTNSPKGHGKPPASKVTITVKRVGGAKGVATAKVGESKGGSAKPGLDYLPKTAVLKWNDGDDDDKIFEIPIVNDKVSEKDESFTVSLTKGTGAPLGTPSRAKVTIKDDDKRRSLAAAPTALRAGGTSSSDIELTWGEGSARGSALHVERGAPDGGDFEEIATLDIAATGFVDHGLPADSTFLYRVRAEGPDGESEVSAIAAAATDGARGGCGEGALCLSGRFEATALWRPAPGAPPQPATRMELVDRPGAGLLGLRGGDDPQLVLEVLDGCAANDHFWVTLGGATDVELLVRVRDTVTGRTWVRYVADGDDVSVRDMDAFATCR